MNNQAVSNPNPRPDRDTIRRSVYSGKYCFIEMYDDGTFGWHWDYFDGKKSTFGAQGNFPGITASEKVKNEIRNRNWTGNMSRELEALATELWKLFEIESRKFR